MVEPDVWVFANHAVHLWVHLTAAAALGREEHHHFDWCYILPRLHHSAQARCIYVALICMRCVPPAMGCTIDGESPNHVKP